MLYFGCRCVFGIKINVFYAETQWVNYNNLHYIEFAHDYSTRLYHCKQIPASCTGPRSAVGEASVSRARVPGYDTWAGHIFSFLLPLIQEGQISVIWESVCTKYLLVDRFGGLSPGKCTYFN